jgi:MipA family protein
MRIPLSLIGALCPLPVLAQTPDAPDSDRIIIGIGGGIAPTYDGSDDYDFQPGGIVQGSVSGFNFAMRGTNLFVDLVREASDAPLDIVAGPVVQLQTNRSGGIKDAQVRALGKISATVEIGGYIGIGKRKLLNPYDTLSFDLAYVRDVGGVHNSHTLTPSISYFTPLNAKTFAIVNISARHVGQGFGRRYFGVTPGGSAASSLASYQIGGSGLSDASTTLLLGRALGADPRKGWSLFAIGSYSRLLGKYARSPIVADAGSRDQWFGVAGLAYSF